MVGTAGIVVAEADISTAAGRLTGRVHRASAQRCCLLYRSSASGSITAHGLHIVLWRPALFATQIRLIWRWLLTRQPSVQVAQQLGVRLHIGVDQLGDGAVEGGADRTADGGRGRYVRVTVRQRTNWATNEGGGQHFRQRSSSPEEIDLIRDVIG
eukprot:5466108-Prymnesium_polylepis.1